MRIALFSAFPHELKETVGKIGTTKPVRSNSFEISRAEYSSHHITIVLTGIGMRNAESALNHVLEEHAPDLVVSMGFGGALYDEARIGEVIWASRVVSLTSGAANELDLRNSRDMFLRLSRKVAIREGSVMTLDTWRKKRDVIKLVPEASLFPVCDMETYPLARLSLERGLTFYAFRSVTDRLDEEISHELLGVSDETGRYRLSRALRLLLSRPALIPGSIKLGLHSYVAGKSLWRTVKALFREL